MIKFFRKIRQNLLVGNKTAKYFKYAIGEIVLVVIGILIALWLNNLNQQRIESQESSILKMELKQELLENKESFKSYKGYAEQCYQKIITVLNVSASKNTEIPMDSLRKLVIEMLPTSSLDINESRLSSAKNSGQFRLLTSVENTALADYNTMLDSFKEARKLNNIFNQENRSLFMNFSVIEAFHSRIYPNVILPKHQGYDLSDEDFLFFLQKKETFKQLNTIFTSILVDIQRLESMDKIIDKTIEVLN
jgi:hypothetical protein